MKKLYLLIAFVCFSLFIKAEPVDTTTAKQLATLFYNQKVAHSVNRRVEPQIVSCAKAEVPIIGTRQTVSRDCYYVVNFDHGFVIIAADDRVEPILGYSSAGTFNPGNIPDNMRAWLDGYKQEVALVIATDRNANEEVSNHWFNLKHNVIETTRSAVEPLLQTTWGQSPYYNQNCPIDVSSSSGHAVTGCVATAMAQIIRYWEYPSTGVGTHSYTANNSSSGSGYGDYGTLTANFGATTYNYSLMPNSLSNYSTTAQINAIATLMYHCGVSVDMMYGSSGSGAYSQDVPYALKTYFSYPAEVQFVSKDNYTNENWKALIINELNNSRPVYYSGSGSGGHAFVCDGYNNNYFHINWGWRGSYNGYFLLSNLNPGDYNFNSDQGAVIGISAPNMNVPTVTTGSVTNISNNSFTCSGNVTDDGGETVTARGVCWGISPNPTIAGNHTTDGGGLGVFSSSCSGLVSGTTYYVRAYATNSRGTAYGEQRSFITLSDNVCYLLNEGFENDGIPMGWTVIDNDGDGQNWFVLNNSQNSNGGFVVHSGDGHITSASYNNAALTPDNWLITPALEITGATTLSFWVAGQDPSYVSEYFGVFLSTTGTNVSNFTVELAHGTATEIMTQYTVDLSAYSGQTVYIAFRHYNVTDMFRINLDDVSVYYDCSGNPTQHGQPCPDVSTLTDIDGNTYNTVQIGGQCWMRENLRTTRYADGTPVAQGSESSYTDAYWYYPNNDTANKQMYGLLYNWKAVMGTSSSSNATPSGVQGICPNGWHVPSDAEWSQLTDYVSSKSLYWCNNDSNNIGKALSSNVGWGNSGNHLSCCYPYCNPSENNATGFSAVPAGNKSYYGYVYFGINAYFWSTTEAHDDQAWRFCSNSTLSRFLTSTTSDGNSVRCLRDEGYSQYFPTVITNDAANITFSSATCGGNVIMDNVTQITERGLCWSIYHNPTINDSHTANGSGTGNFISNLMGLSPNFTYYVRAYATCQYGTVYGNEISFTTPINPNGDEYSCPGMPTVSDNDGNVYSTVQIGGQCWIRENLRTTRYADGTPVAQGSESSYTDAYWYYPNNDTANKQIYGLLYNWKAVMGTSSSSNATPSGVQGICPNGWHVPSDVEWSQLTDYVSSRSEYWCNNDSGNIAKALSGVMGWKSYNSSCCYPYCNPSENNATGFSAVPAGYKSSDYEYFSFGSYAYFWSATESYDNFAWRFCSNSTLDRLNANRFYGYSVRCLRDEGYSQYFPTVITNDAANITFSGATCGGNVIMDNGVQITERGLCWSIYHNPTKNDSHTANGSGTGNFINNLMGLSPNVIYYARAYATCQYGTVYGNEISFTTPINPNGDENSCPGMPTVSDNDGNVYSTVQIGGQCWMRENLRTTQYADGTSIIQGYSDNLDNIGCWYYPNNDTANKQVYGLLYNWKAVMGTSSSSNATPSGVQGICPNGWHVPSDVEWSQLTDYVSSRSEYWCNNDSGNIAKALSGVMGWKSYNSSCCGPYCNPIENNATGFSAVPAGYVVNLYTSFGSYAYFWSATEEVSSSARMYFIKSWSGYTEHDNEPKDLAYSVRCLRDEGYSQYFPTVITNSVTDITPTTSVCGGSVTAANGVAVTAKGVCWSTSHYPTVNDSHTVDGNGLGGFTSNLMGLSSNFTYYVRAYATNQYGTVYGNEVSFATTINPYGDEHSCPGMPTVSDNDGNVYNTVQIGGQCWLRENLRTTRYADGSVIEQGSNASTTTAYYYYPNNDTTNKRFYGLLYNWKAVMGTSSSSDATPSGVQGICPNGWHVPSDAEWTQLSDYVSSQSEYWCENNSSNIAKALSSVMGWDNYYSSSYSCCAPYCNPSENNATGFSIVPAGRCYFYHNYNDTVVYLSTSFGSDAYFWSATENGSSARFHNLSEYSYTMTRAFLDKSTYSSVRCLRNDGQSQFFPTVTTNDVSNMASTTATCGGNVTYNGNASVTSRGVCWSINHYPTVKDHHTVDGNGIGGFTSGLTGLVSNFTYYVRAYATNEYGTVYGNEVSFTTPINPNGDEHSCPGVPTVSDNDGNVYNTVQIGGQCWMRENLRTTRYADGTSITQGNDTSNTIAYWYYPNDDSTTKQTYGLLYNWKAVMRESSFSNNIPSGVQGICPNGWHVPSDAEWVLLMDYVSSQSEYRCDNNSSSIAKALASTEGWYSTSSRCTPGNIPSDNNGTGFGIMPAGMYYLYSGDITLDTYLWSTTAITPLLVKCYVLGTSVSYVEYGFIPKEAGFSVRCLRDESHSQYFPIVTTDSITDITYSTSTSGGNVSVTNGTEVIARGVCWSTSHYPTIMDDHTTNGSGIGHFNSSLTGLSTNLTYYVRAYATNQYGTVYGNEVSFVTPINIIGDGYSCPNRPVLADRDGNMYNTVQIGGQCWMRENLRTTHYADGTFISQGIDTSTITAYWYYPHNDTTYKQSYGLLYNWKAVMGTSFASNTIPSGVQGICPNGWHVPSDAEWIQLTDYVSSRSEYWCNNDSSNIAKALAGATGWGEYSEEECELSYSPNSNNATGFGALPAGSNEYHDFSYWTDFWSTTENGTSKAGRCGMGGPKIDYYNTYKYYGLSVRCIHDENDNSSIPSVTTDFGNSITATTATFGGNVISDGGSNVVARGVCWSTMQNPTISDSHTVDGDGIGSFISNITSLIPNTTYYIRAYAVNSAGVAYGTQRMFTTSCNAVSVNISGDSDCCYGESATLTASGANSYLWSPNANSSTNSSVIVTPTVTSTYIVTGTNQYGCSSTANVTVFVHNLPTINISGDNDICYGESTTLTASGANNYQWSSNANSSTNATITVTPTSTTTYTVTGINQYGCLATANKTITVHSLPNVTISDNYDLCVGESATLTAYGASSYQWDANANSSTNATITVTPISTTSYTVTGSDQFGCSSSDTVTVTVHNLPTVSISGETNICYGESTTLTASGANNYQWSSNANYSTNASVTVIPYSTITTYTVTGTDQYGCSSTANVIIFIQMPNVTISGDNNICYSECTTLTASGANSYQWSSNANNSTGSSVIVTPASTAIYTVTGTNQYGCSATANVTVFVHSLPSIIISGDNDLCIGDSTTLTAYGASSYQWSANANNSTDASVTVTPASTTIYSVTGTNQYGCSSTANMMVSVHNLPNVIISGDNDLCVGESTTLTAYGADIYQWDTYANGSTNASVIVTPTSTTTYTVTGTNQHGCSATTDVTISVHGLPSVAITGVTSISYGQSITLTASGATSYLWSANANNVTTESIMVTPIANTTYYVVGTDIYGCSNTASFNVIVNFDDHNVEIEIACESYEWHGQTYTESGNYIYNHTNADGSEIVDTLCLTINHGTHNVETEIACESYVWHGELYTEPGTYLYYYNNAYNCESVDTLHLDINYGDNSMVYDTICTSELPFEWNGVIFTDNSTQTVILQNSKGCDSVVIMTLVVLPVPSVSIYGDTSFCEGNSVVLTAVGASNYIWSDGSTQSHITVSQSGTYTVTSTNDYSCSSTASVNVIAYPLPQIVINGNTTICEGESTILTASGAEQYLWNTGQQTASINVNSFGIYTVTGTSSIGCYNTASVVITVSPSPVIGITGNTDICQGESTTLTANGGVTYIWNNGSTNAALTVNTAGIYQVIATDENGCVNMNSVTVNVWNPESSEFFISDTSCYFWNNVEYCESGDYTQTLQTVHGCDSVVTLHLAIELDINNRILTTAMKVYPNPTTDKICVKMMTYNGQLDDAEIHLFDIYGNWLNTWKVIGENAVIDLSSFAAGLYIIKVVGDQHLIGVRKVLKISK